MDLSMASQSEKRLPGSLDKLDESTSGSKVKTPKIRIA